MNLLFHQSYEQFSNCRELEDKLHKVKLQFEKAAIESKRYVCWQNILAQGLSWKQDLGFVIWRLGLGISFSNLGPASLTESD